MRGPETSQIQKMFGEVAKKYDLANSVLSLGIHHIWRKKLAKTLKENLENATSSVLDCATGTGDVIFELAKVLPKDTKLVATDFCEPMLAVAKDKQTINGTTVDFSIEDVCKLSFADNSFDAVTISFGIRNTENPSLAMSEMLRVTKPGGHVYVLEFGKVTLSGLSKLFEFYRKSLLPRIGGLVTGKKKAYDYLNKSSAEFPCGDEFLHLIKNNDTIKTSKYTKLSHGIAYLYIVQKVRTQ